MVDQNFYYPDLNPMITDFNIIKKNSKSVLKTLSGLMLPFGNTKPTFYEELNYSDDIKFLDNLIIKLTHLSTHSCI